MSVRSEWQLAFKGARSKVLKLEKFLQKALHDEKRSTVEKTAVNVILNNKLLVAEKQLTNEEGEPTKGRHRAIAFGHSATNCDGVWDGLVEEVLTLARDTLKLKASYARLGGDMDDFEFDCHPELPISYSRYLTEVEL